MNDDKHDVLGRHFPPRTRREKRLLDHLMKVADGISKSKERMFFSARKDCSDLTDDFSAIADPAWREGGFKVYRAWKGLGLKWGFMPWIIGKARIRLEIWLICGNLEAVVYNDSDIALLNLSNAFIREYGREGDEIRIEKYDPLP